MTAFSLGNIHDAINQQAGTYRSAEHTLGINTYADTFAEVYELMQEGLIGEDSTAAANVGAMMSNSAGAISLTQWSETDNARWHALNQDGEAGKQAAGYLEQMVSERRNLTDSYLGGYQSMAGSLQKNVSDSGAVPVEEGGNMVSLDWMLDNAAAGRPVTQKPDGTEHPRAAELQSWWDNNTHNLKAVQDDYAALKTFPRDTQSWLEARNITPSAEVDAVLDKHVNDAGLPAITDSSDDFQWQNSRIGSGSVTDAQLASASAGWAENHLPKTTTGLREYIADLRDELREDLFEDKDQAGVQHWVASGLLNQERSNLHSSVSQLGNGLFAQFRDQLHNPAHADFTLQDVMENYLAGTPLGQLADGSQHPDAAAIEQFWQDNQLTLTQYSDQQQQFQQLPRTPLDYMQQQEAKIEQFMAQFFPDFATGNDASNIA